MDNFKTKINFKLLVVSVSVLLQPALTTLSQAETIINPDQWVVVPELPDPNLNNLNITANAASIGMFSPRVDWPMNGLHASLLPDGKVLTFGDSSFQPATTIYSGRLYDVWDPSLGLGNNSHDTVFDASRQDSFCASVTYLENGDLLISGGNDDFSAVNSTVFQPTTNSSYDDPAQMAENRWYPTILNLPDGRPLIMGGMVPATEYMAANPDLAIANGLPSMTPEIYEDGKWRSLFGAYSREAFGPDFLRTSYPRAWVAPNGLVFGISADKMWYLDADAKGGNGDIVNVWDFKKGYSAQSPVNVGATNSAVMYAPGRILQVGGNGGENADALPASNMATVVDIRGGAPVLREQTPMKFARRYPNTIVLPTGEVMVSGGTTYGNHYPGEPGDVVYSVETWNPDNGKWSMGPNAPTIRVYHSATTLLTDGSVLSTGGGSPGPVLNLNAEIYFPPYLFRAANGGSELAPRPRIAAISGLTYKNNAALQLDLAAEENIKELVLIGLSSMTHSFNTGQRRIPLEFSQYQFRLTTQLPNANLAPPGYYQVIAINDQGTPSKGVIIGIGPNRSAPPIIVTPYTPPSLEEAITTPTIGAGATVTYGIAPEVGATYSWKFSDTGEKTPFSADPQVSHTFTKPGLYVVTLTARAANGDVSVKTVVQAVSTARTANAPSSSSQLALDGDRVWVVNPDNDSISVIGTGKSLVKEIKVGKSPRAVAVAPNGQIWVTNKKSASISVIDPGSLSVTRTINLPRASQPDGLAFSPTQSVAFVVLEASGKLLKLNAGNGDQLGQLAVGENPRHVAVSANGQNVLVSRFITPPLDGEGTTMVDTETVGAEVLVVDGQNLSLKKTIKLGHSYLPDTRTQGRGIPNYLGAAVISPDGGSAWVPSKQDNITRGIIRNGQPLNFENTVRAISSYINMGNLSENINLRADHDNASLASAAAWHPNGVYLFVALETSREVVAINGLDGTELFRIQVGIAPQSLAVSADGLTLYVKEFMERQVSIVDLKPLINTGILEARVTTTVNTVQKEALPADVLAGKKLFYDARDRRLSKDSYMSCATCHNDGGQDGRVWDLTNLGSGLRNTIALNGRAATEHGFMHWSANFDELQDFESQIRDLAGGSGLMRDSDFQAGSRSQPLGDKKAGVSKDLDNLAAYVRSLSEFAPSPYRQANGGLSSGAQAGKALFADNCQSCHGGSAFTLSQGEAAMEDIGTTNAASGKRLGLPMTTVDIPTLRDAWATAPYLHNGSAPTLAAAIRAHETISLSSGQIANLVEYVQQIGGEEAGAGIFADGRWNFNEGSGNRVADDSGKNNPLTLSNVRWEQDRAGYVGRFNGFNSIASTNKPMVDTAGSFSVSAWVKLDHYANWQVIANQDGAQISGFWLQYSRYLGRKFAFSMHDADATNSTPYRAVSKTSPVVGRWYHLVGVRDRAQGTLKLYVDGKLETTTQFAGGWTSNGSFNVGMAKWQQQNQATAGAIDDVSVYRYSMSEKDVTQLYDMDRPNYAPTINLVAPQTKTLYKEGAVIKLQANASDPDDAVTEVRFYSGSQLLEVDSSAPWSYEWTSAPIGTHTVTAVAIDARGVKTTSAPITLFVEDAALTNLAASAKLDTSYITPWQSLTAIVDGFEPTSSRDLSHGGYGNLAGRRSFGVTNWVSFSWDSPKKLTSTEVYWWSDGLGVLQPTTATVEYWDGGQWVSLGNIGVQLNTFNRLDIDVTTSSLRILMQGERATGILETKVKGFP